jgi:hypothetical protein
MAAHFLNSYAIPFLFSASVSSGSLCLLKIRKFVLQKLQRVKGLRLALNSLLNIAPGYYLQASLQQINFNFLFMESSLQ